jgi:hypothetical protein
MPTYRMGSPVYPDASTTGVPVGTSLTNANFTQSSSNGEVIDALNLDGWDMLVQHNNVTIKRCRIKNSGFWCIRVLSGVTGCIIQDCELDGDGGGGQGVNCAGAATIERCNIHHCADGVNAAGDGMIIRNNYMHDFAPIGAGAHFDGVQTSSSNMLIDRNNIDVGLSDATATVEITNTFGSPSNITISNGLHKGGSYTFHVFNSNNVTISNMRLGEGVNGFSDLGSNTNFQQSNIIDDATGLPITL